jgi:hypothetical protein
MANLSTRIIDLLRESPGLSDREITDKLVGKGRPQQHVNATCRRLAERGFINRTTRFDGRIGNYLSNQDRAKSSIVLESLEITGTYSMSEDAVKEILKSWLESKGWTTSVAWGNSPGIDIEATKGSERWIIEVKGPGSRPQMRVNYFLAVIGELLQKIDDPNAKYSLALPELPQFRRLWDRLSHLAKSRTTISALFVSPDGRVDEVA